MVVADDSAPVFSERLYPSPLAWLVAPAVGAFFSIMFLPVSIGLALGVGAVVAIIVGLSLWSLAATVELTRTHLRVGRARIEVEALGEVQVCTAKEMTFHMGPGSDARSFVLTRPWVRTGIYIEQTDPRDPTPYWLFSLRHPQELHQRLRALKGE